MFELMNDKALEVGAERRREVAIETMRAARADVARLRRAARTFAWAIGRVSAAIWRRRAPRLQREADGNLGVIRRYARRGIGARR